MESDINPREFPILEFDPARNAIIEPSRLHRAQDAPEHAVLCFFNETIDKVCGEGRGRQIASYKWEDRRHVVYEIEHRGQRLAVAHPGVGAPVAVGMLEELIAIGCTKIIACGGAGVLDKGIAVGHLLIPIAAVRDEGTSYHYLPPSREVEPSAEGVAAIERTLRANGVEYLLCKTWTTDAPFRETASLVHFRRAEGCLTVEMEASAFFAVSRFRGVTFAEILYGGDDVSGLEWSHRGWDQRNSIREELFRLAADACLSI